MAAGPLFPYKPVPWSRQASAEANAARALSYPLADKAVEKKAEAIACLTGKALRAQN